MSSYTNNTQGFIPRGQNPSFQNLGGQQGPPYQSGIQVSRAGASANINFDYPQLPQQIADYLKKNPMVCTKDSGGFSSLNDKRNSLSLWRFTNPIYWGYKFVDYGRRQHCLRLGPQAYGSYCTKNAGPANYDPDEVYRNERSLYGYHGSLLPKSIENGLFTSPPAFYNKQNQ